jgi:ADP-ribosylglycohydrolase/catechol 2,3-dioxygenase-like lactoylglutathione lyase family enzyme
MAVAFLEKLSGSYLGSAVGDALGWPFEDRSRSVGSDTRHAPAPGDRVGFREWKRKKGTRFAACLEPIAKGSYSDDTQLLIVTHQSLVQKVEKDWSKWFSTVGLPFWFVYEQGGGGATKRAAQGWMKGQAPWQMERSIERYAQAGGNGVAMRILPIVAQLAEEKSFESLALEILLNGICTHGHPRALIGALVYAYGLWSSFQLKGTLSYGDLLQNILDNRQKWGALPYGRGELSGWLDAIDRHSSATLKFEWDATVEEVISLINLGSKDLEMGPLATGPDTLAKFGAFDPKINGAGTITAVSALFMASRFAVSPRQGLTVAATLQKADSDTLASMIGGLLGAMHGVDWLEELRQEVQDGPFLQSLATNSVPGQNDFSGQRVHEKAIQEFKSEIAQLKEGSGLRLLDGRRSKLKKKEVLPTLHGSQQFSRSHLETEDGQTIFIVSSLAGSKKTKTSSAQRSNLLSSSISLIPVARIGVKIFVNDLEEARSFYSETLGLPLEKESSRGLTVGGIISLVLRAKRSKSRSSALNAHPVLMLKVPNLNQMQARLNELGIRTLDQADLAVKYPHFYVRDPSGNYIEIF